MQKTKQGPFSCLKKIGKKIPAKMLGTAFDPLHLHSDSKPRLDVNS